MSRKTFLYYLFNKAKKPLYKSAAGYIEAGTDNYLKQNGEPAHLEVSPDGWANTLVKYGRNTKYWGVFRDFTVPMRFVKDGRDILRQQFWRGRGVEEVVYLGIAKLDRFNLPYNYLAWFLCELNFAKFKQAEDGVVVEALEGGLSKYLKAFEGTEYEIGLSDDAEAVTVIMDGMEIDNAATFTVTNGASIAQAGNIGNHLLDTLIINKEIEDIGGVYDVQRTKVAGNNPSVFASRLYAFKATAAGTLHIKWADIQVQLTYVPPPAINPDAIFRIQARIINPDAVNNVTKVITLEGWAANELGGGTYTLEGEGTLDVVPGDELYFVGAMTVEGAGGDAQLEVIYGGTEPRIDITYTYRAPASRVKALRPFRLLQKLVEKMTGGLYTAARSTFLEQLTEVAITSGDALRGNEPSVIKTSFEKFRKSMARWMTGVGIENDVMVLERLKYFFSDEVIMDLGEVGRIEIDVAEDLFFNTIKNGYNTQEYGDIGGRQEFNQGQQWTTAMTRIVKEFDLVSEYRADALGAELMRINFGKLKTTDSRADNDTWMLSVTPDSLIAEGHVFFVESDNRIETFFVGKFAVGQVVRITGTEFNNGTYTVQRVVNFLAFETVWLQGDDTPLTNEITETARIEIIQGGVYSLWRPQYTYTEGIPHPASAFNTMLRPKLALVENSALLHSILDLQEGTAVEFQKADKNADIVTSIGLQTIREKEALQVGNMAPKLFRPYYLTFKTQVPADLLDVMERNPYGKIKFSSEGRVYYGYLFDGGIKPSTNDVQQWKLLSAPENDLYPVS